MRYQVASLPINQGIAILKILRTCIYFLLAVIGILPANMSAFQQEFCFGVVGEYRRDSLSQNIKIFDPPQTPVHKNHLKVEDISIWQVGLTGTYVLCDDWLVKGALNFGTVSGAKYTEKLTTIKCNCHDFTEAANNGGQTRDYLIGIGYVPCCRDCLGDLFRIGPILGWSYHYQKVKMKHGEINEIRIDVLDDFLYEMHWEGPWLGLDAELRFCDFTINMCYEYHWARWRSNWLLDGPDVPGIAFSDHRESNNAYGQVFILETSLELCSCVEMGIGLKYQKWKATEGRERPVEERTEAGISPTEIDKVRNATWKSWGFFLDFGCFF